MTRRHLRLLYWSIEINLILWIVLVGALLAPAADVKFAGKVAIVGFALSALLQHWAYYHVRRAYVNQTTQVRSA